MANRILWLAALMCLCFLLLAAFGLSLGDWVTVVIGTVGALGAAAIIVIELVLLNPEES